ncbi:hypothetical protein EV182_000973 [Spiromyces aspiralis]|uniref:Uncharacterized protein n=1 Tax=Spiromyces aspiralis TaxID=68401 RepID=A0ACC1HGJ6_9FUNG|nr:hypothetical protein EV182_000973 [Spiromyces aspiralis]
MEIESSAAGSSSHTIDGPKNDTTDTDANNGPTTAVSEPFAAAPAATNPGPSSNGPGTGQSMLTDMPENLEYIKKEKTLAEFLVQMDQYSPIIPDALMDYYLAQAGFECSDVRIKRLLALATQKFISDIATDAFQYNRIRQQASKEKRILSRDRKTVLTMEDLAAALAEHGVNVKKPDYFM